MTLALVLVDLQRDYLAAPGLVPSADELVLRVAGLLARARAAGAPVIHVRTSVTRPAPGAPDPRMPHWQAADLWRCVVGTPGWEPPPALAERAGEAVVGKAFFDGFASGELERALRAAACDGVVLAGLHEHACVRATALGAYERGFRVVIAEDAVGSDDPIHAAAGRRWLGARAARYVESAVLFGADAAPEAPGPARGGPALDAVVAAARTAQQGWARTTMAERGALLEAIARTLEARSGALATLMAEVLGKPVSVGGREVSRAARLCRSAGARVDEPLDVPAGPTSRRRHMPVGTFAAITPWNNPIAIPLGKIAPALLYGNGLVMKPAPAADAVARALSEALAAAGVPDGLVGLISGGRETGLALLEHPGIDAATVTGALGTGHVAQAVCARRMIPLQAELGGNNAAIVWTDADHDRAARLIASGVFVFAGQRCTANRRAIVPEAALEGFVARLRAVTEGLPVGDPHDPATLVGPMVSAEARARVAGVVARARAAGCEVWQRPGGLDDARFMPPTIVVARDPRLEVVQQETFGPVLVVQPARDFDHALDLVNGVPQGLAAALFSPDEERRARFLAEVEAGILKLDSATVDADTEAPFGGWKASGVGPPEHGASNRELFTRAQAVYRA